MRNKNLRLVILVSILCLLKIEAQQIDFDNIGRGKPIKISGNIAANTVFYSSNQNNARSPFTYFLQGSLNFSIYEFSIPVSYSFSNQGEDLEYQLPFNFNRLSLHPRYRWIQAHIGDVTMSFSPYTLAGHQFTGGGVELTPNGGFTFSAMSGRLLKATEDSTDERTIPAYRRMGYGAKFGYTGKRYSVEVIGFYAKDEENSISAVPEDKQVFPKENLVLSLGGSVAITDGLQFSGEYASTAITKDTRAEKVSFSQGLAGLFFNNRASTEHYKAFRTELNYTFDKYNFGVGYERIDPGYETLGGYFFNNDFENITLNGTTSLFSNKVNLSFNVGFQRDDLANQKETATSRTVGSVNASYAMNKKVNISASYSNFTTFTNNRLDQFDIINDDNLIDNQDQLFDYRQLSQNANFNVGYIIENSKNRRQNLNTNYSLATVANEQNGIVRIGDGSTFHNFNSSYSIGLPQRKLNISTSLNATYNTIGTQDSYTWGPTVAVGKKFLKDKLNTTLGASYNQSAGAETNSSNANIRLNANYILQEKHNFNLNVIQLFRSTSSAPSTTDLTVTFGYNYPFDLSAAKKKKKSKNKEDKSDIYYKDQTFTGGSGKITSEILELRKDKKYTDLALVNTLGDEMVLAEQEMINAELKSRKRYKKKAEEYLELLEKYENFSNKYYDLNFKILQKLYNDARKQEEKVEQKFARAKMLYDSTNGQRKKKLLKDLKKKESAYTSNKLIIEELKNIKKTDVIENSNERLTKFKKANYNKVYKMIEEGKTDKEISLFLELSYIKMYHSI
ncbi:conserved hypothetical protein [Tenacibaculum sp. 190524A05c]|uniref:hypothetical protein n=1 Tax=Tenacibaculum platacis TaxID=3137852 RepID=UPI0031FB24DB